MSGDVVGKRFGNLLASAFYVAVAGVVLFAVFLKRDALIECGFKVGKDNGKTFGFGRICAKVCKDTGVEGSDFFGFEEIFCALKVYTFLYK